MSSREHRRFHRVALDLPAQITVNAMDDYEGKLINISPGSMAIEVKADVLCGDAVVIAVKDLDIVEGRVARIFPGGFAVSFMLSRKRRRILTEKLMIIINKNHARDLEDRRRTPRHPNIGKRLVCRLPDGTSLFAKLIDQSVEGISVDAERKPPIGTPMNVGRSKGVVLRHTPRGFVVAYVDQLEKEKQNTDAQDATSHLRAI